MATLDAKIAAFQDRSNDERTRARLLSHLRGLWAGNVATSFYEVRTPLPPDMAVDALLGYARNVKGFWRNVGNWLEQNPHYARKRADWTSHALSRPDAIVAIDLSVEEKSSLERAIRVASIRREVPSAELGRFLAKFNENIVERPNAAAIKRYALRLPTEEVAAGAAQYADLGYALLLGLEPDAFDATVNFNGVPLKVREMYTSRLFDNQSGQNRVYGLSLGTLSLAAQAHLKTNGLTRATAPAVLEPLERITDISGVPDGIFVATPDNLTEACGIFFLVPALTKAAYLVGGASAPVKMRGNGQKLTPEQQTYLGAIDKINLQLQGEYRSPGKVLREIDGTTELFSLKPQEKYIERSLRDHYKDLFGKYPIEMLTWAHLAQASYRPNGQTGAIRRS